jgi:hypothetical protein
VTLLEVITIGLMLDIFRTKFYLRAIEMPVIMPNGCLRSKKRGVAKFDNPNEFHLMMVLPKATPFSEK